MRLGDSRIVPINVRLIASTHRNLRQMVSQGHFREDLYYRINVIELNVPPLRDRGDDVLALAEHLLGKHGSPAALDESARHALLSYAFPGNVRELENMLERAVTLCSSGTIAAAATPRR